MDRKSILILAFTAFFLIMIGFSVIVFLKLKRPDILGLPPAEADTTAIVEKPVKQLELEPTFEITADKLNQIKREASNLTLIFTCAHL